MDSIFVEGLAATISAIIVFCGSVWLLLALVLGPRLSYFITASVTLGFLLMMGVVWSTGDVALGPVGELPSYATRGVGDSPAEAGFGPAADYPDGGGWFAPSADDPNQGEVKTGAEGAAPKALEAAIEKGDVTAFERADEAAVDTDGTRLLEQDGVLFAAVRFQPLPDVPEEEDAPSDQDIAPEEGDSPAEDDAAAEAEGEPVDENAEAFVFLEQDPGNELGDARKITLGILVVFVLHLAGLSASERRARRVRAEA